MYYSYTATLGHPEEIIIDLVKELKPEPSVLTFQYDAMDNQRFFCRWDFKTKKKENYMDSDDFKRPAEGTLLVQGLEPDKPNLKWDDGRYVTEIVHRARFFKREATEYDFDHKHHTYSERALLHHVVLPEYCYYKSGTINKDQASIWKADTRTCITWLNDIKSTNERQYSLSFRFAGPNKKKFETMKEERQQGVKAGIKGITISEGEKQTVMTITTLMTPLLEFWIKHGFNAAGLGGH